jgi:soluble lytic murein transglycosylase
MAATRTRSRPARSRSVKRTPAPARRRRLRVGRLLGLAVVVAAIAAAIVVFLLPSKVVQEFLLPLRHEDIIRQQSQEKGVDASLIAAVIYAESRFTDQTSEADARGLMQITPETARDIERLSGGQTFVLEDLSNPDINIRYGTFYLRHLLDVFDGNEVAALAAYNAGPGNAAEWGGSGMEIGDIEFSETRGYVEQVLDKREDYRRRYAEELGY